MVPAAALPGLKEPAESSERITFVFQKEAACGWKGRRTAAKYELLEDESTEWAKGQWRTAAEICHGEREGFENYKDVRINRN